MSAVTINAGKKQLIVKADGDNTIFEFWHGSSLAKEIMIPKALHGKVYADNWFGLGVSWSSDETHIAYVAEVRFCTLSLGNPWISLLTSIHKGIRI